MENLLNDAQQVMSHAERHVELRRAVRSMASMLGDREWGEHISRDPDASDLESAITTLISELSEKQGRIDELEQALTTNDVDSHKSGNVDDKPAEPKPYWITCHVCGQAFNQSAGQVHCDVPIIQLVQCETRVPHINKGWKRFIAVFGHRT